MNARILTSAAMIIGLGVGSAIGEEAATPRSANPPGDIRVIDEVCISERAIGIQNELVTRAAEIMAQTRRSSHAFPTNSAPTLAYIGSTMELRPLSLGIMCQWGYHEVPNRQQQGNTNNSFDSVTCLIPETSAAQTMVRAHFASMALAQARIQHASECSRKITEAQALAIQLREARALLERIAEREP